jgi:TatD DNase family protein
VDSHCHLDSTQTYSGLDPADAIRLAAEVGVTRIVQIGCDPDGCRWASGGAERWSSVIAGVAIIPMTPLEWARISRLRWSWWRSWLSIHE